MKVLYESAENVPMWTKKTQTELNLTNGAKIFSLPGANPDTIRGYSAPDLIIEDEAAFVGDRTFVASRPMLATNPFGRHILLTTPYGRRGHFYDRWRQKDPDWARFMIRSEDCPRISEEFLEGEQRVLSERSYRQEYRCDFLEAATAVFPSDFIERLMSNKPMSLEDTFSMSKEEKAFARKMVDEDGRHGIDPMDAVEPKDAMPDDLKEGQPERVLQTLGTGPGPWANLG